MNGRSVEHKAFEVLDGPFNTAPNVDGMEPTRATVDLVKGQVAALLASTPSYHGLSATEKSNLSNGLTRIAAYSAECLREICWQSRSLGQTPVVREKREIAPPLAQAAADSFKPKAADQIGRITEQTLKAIAFPTFVADLIRGTFEAIVRTSSQQMESFMELVKNVSKTVDEFMQDNVSDDQARGWLAQQYPGHIRVENGRAVPSDGADERPAPNFQRDLNLSGDVGLDESALEETLVPAARRRLAERRLQMLSTLVMMGVNRIVVTGGKIRATMGFHIDTSDRARQENASSTDFRLAVAGGVNMGWWNVSASTSLAYVTSTKSASDDEINVESDLTGEVEIHFKSDYFPVERFATKSMLGSIQNNTAVPDQNPPPGGTANPVGDRPAAGGEVSRYGSLRTRRREPLALPELPAVPPEARLPEKPIAPDTLHPTPPPKPKDENEADAKKDSPAKSDAPADKPAESAQPEGEEKESGSDGAPKDDRPAGGGKTPKGEGTQKGAKKKDGAKKQGVDPGSAGKPPAKTEALLSLSSPARPAEPSTLAAQWSI